MYRQPVNTEQKPTSQPSLCSILSKKLYQRTQKGHEQGKEGSRLIPEHDKPKRDDGAKKNKERKEVADKCEIKTVLKMLKRTTPFLPKALLSPHAYEKGKNGCEMCNMDKESYKPFLKSGKVIQLIADDIISKEQKEMLDCDDKQNEIQDTNKLYGKNDIKGEIKISIQFEVYWQKQIDHNLKCVLLNLQKTIGDVILQVCYYKSNKIPGDDKYTMYAVSTTVLEQLQFEYTNLTSKIIQIFKNSSTKPKVLPEVCVAYIKEDITDCTKKFEKILKNGRNLKVILRNEDTDEDGKCCSRTYPHVHAIVQGKHVVLKFELPFKVTQPHQKSDGKPKDKVYEEFPRIDTPPPYDEWPKDFNPEPTKDGNQIKPLKEEGVVPEKDTTPSKPNSLPEEKAPEKSSSVSDKSTKSLKKLESFASHVYEEFPSTDISQPYDEWPKDVDPEPVKESERYCGCNFNLVYEKLNVDQYKNNNLQKPESDKLLEQTSDRMSGSFLDYDNYSSFDSVSMDKKQQNKQVRFYPEEKKTIFYVRDTSPQSVFLKVHNNDEQPPQSFDSKNSKIVKLKETSLSPVGPVVLMKNKFSLSEKSTMIKELEQNQSSGTFLFSVPRYNIKQALHTGPTIVDLQRKTHDKKNVLPDKYLIKHANVHNKGEETKDIRIKNRSVTNFRTTDLRYLSVEYPHIINKIKISVQDQSCRVAKSKSHPCLHRCYRKHLDRSRHFNRNTNKLYRVISAKRVDQGHESEYSFDARSSITKIISSKSRKLSTLSKICNKNRNLSPVDEMIMLNVIYLTSNNNSNKFITDLDSANNISKCYGDNMKLFKPWGSSIKLSKLISSHGLCNQNIPFDMKATSSTSSSKMQMVNSERKEDLTKQTEQKFQDNLNTSLINKITAFKSDNGLNTIVNGCINTNIKNEHFRDISSSAENCNATNNISQKCIAYGENGFIRSKITISSNKIVKCDKTEIGLITNNGCCKLLTEFQNSSESRDVLHSVSKKEKNFVKSPTNWNSITVKNKLNLNHHNLNHRNYFIFKKYKNVTAKCDKPTYKKLKRKPSILKNTQISFKSVKCNISKPVIKFAKITNVTSHYEVPHFMLSPENHDSNVIENFGLQTNYKCVNNYHKSESEPSPSNLTSSLKSHVEQSNESHRNKNVYTDLEKLASLSSGVSFIAADPLTTNEKHIYSSDHMGIPFYLFDVNGQPLTDTSGRPLHNSNGEMLVQLDRAELPLCDLNNCPIFDSSGHAVDENDFNPFEPPFSDILKVLTPLGDPMVLYDFEGRPLTSASGTMLMDSKGRGLLRFNCKGNPVTDYRGKPIFNSKGKEVVETK